MWLLNLLSRQGRLRFSRYRHIISTLIRYGFGEIVYQTGTAKLIRVMRKISFRRKPEEAVHIERYSTWQRVRMTVEQLGPTFIKLGQILSNRPDLIPRELQNEIEKLQENVPPFSADKAAGVIEEDLGATVEELFDSFDREPVAAASIAQIHWAVLKDGSEVAVKIERPGLRELVEVDVSILRELAGLLVRYVPESTRVGPKELVDEFERDMMQELDFRREAASIERFAAQFEGNVDVKIPKVYPKYSTRRVLTMEFVTGTPLSSYMEEDPGDRDEVSRIAEVGADFTLDTAGACLCEERVVMRNFFLLRALNSFSRINLATLLCPTW
jgi:ubiquinone biosynthesis protein